jgi:hypothetical protein
LQIHREKAHTAKTPVAEQKFNAAKENYLNLNDELLKDIPLLIDDRVPFFEPCMAALATHLGHYYENCRTIVGDLSQSVAKVDRSGVLDHPRITTPVEASAATHKISVAKGEITSVNSTRRNTTALTSTEVNNAFEKEASTPQPQPSQAQAKQRTATVGPTANPPMANPNAARKQPPIPPSKTVKAKALYDFAAQEHNELAFRVGDVLTILNQNGDWWEGELNGRRGLIPGNYVQLL